MRGKENAIKRISEIRKDLKERSVPKWLKIDRGAGLKGAVTNLPQKEDIGFSIQEQLIVELYSK